MSTNLLQSFLTDDHRHCDEGMATVEDHVQRARWQDAEPAFAAWRRAMGCHLAREEELLFPAFERATGMDCGPTAMMRLEHTQMREVIDALAAALAARDGRRFLGLSESLQLLVQQHNMKEENVLYPMCDQVIPERATLAADLAARRG